MQQKILIIEDSDGAAELQRRALAREGFIVSIASSGSDAMQLLSDELPDLLVIDYRLPDMTGVEILEQLNHRDITIPSIMVTSAGDENVAVSAMKLGALDYIVKDGETAQRLPGICREVLKRAHLAQENIRLIVELQQVNRELIEANRRLEHLSRTDDLTEIYNRRYLLERLGSELNRSERYRIPLCLALIDVDHFKSVNDRFGHAMGDTVLCQFAALLKSRIRKTDFLGRYGGEEFAIVLTESTLEQAALVCDELRRKIEVYSFGNHTDPITLTASIGVAELRQEMSIDNIVDLADQSMYEAKNRGRNTVSAIQLVNDMNQS